MSEAEQPKTPKPADGLSERLGRGAGRLVKQGWPGVRRLAEEMRPHAESTGRGAMRYAKEHDAEIKSAGMRLLRRRFVGPFGVVIDALESELRRGAAEEASKAAESTCGACGTSNGASAKFCSECGSRLAPDA